VDVDQAGPRARVRFAWDCRSTPRALGPKHECPGITGQHRGPSEPGRSCPGHMVEPVGPWAWARVAQETRSTPRALGHRPEFREQLVDTEGPRTQARVTRDSWSTVGPQTRTRVVRESWSTMRALGPGPVSPGPTWGH